VEKYRVLRSFCLGGGINAFEGDVLEVPSALMDAGRASIKAKTGWLEKVSPNVSPAPLDVSTESEEDLEGEDHPTEGDLESNAPTMSPPRRGRKPRGEAGK